MAPLSVPVIGTFLLLMDRASAEEAACEFRIENLDEFTEGGVSSVPLPSPDHEFRLHILLVNNTGNGTGECHIKLKDSSNVSHTLSPCTDAVCRDGWFLDEEVAANTFSLNYVAANSTMPEDGLYQLQTKKGKD